MKARVAIAMTGMMAVLLAAPAQAQPAPAQAAQTAPHPAASLPDCGHHKSMSADCHIPDRKTYIDMSADRPDPHTQPHATGEFREWERLEFLQQTQ